MSARVVVGVDGSDTAKRAVRWAAREATLRGAKLELVCAWEIPVSNYAFAYGMAGVPEGAVEGLAERAEAHLAAALHEARLEVPDIRTETMAIEGQPANVLRDISNGAELLVVGSRGLGGFRELLLGSVSQQCAQHATCPVVIVWRGSEEAAA